MPPSEEQVLADTRRWLERAVIGLNLCPFAKAVHAKRQVRFVVSGTDNEEVALRVLREELALIAASDPALHDTTLIVLPNLLADFLGFNDFLARAERLPRKMRLEGVLQVASFHPQFTFEGTEAGDVTNFTNRSPYPMLHLLREASIDRAVEAFPDPASIYETNMAVLRKLGRDGWQALDVGASK